MEGIKLALFKAQDALKKAESDIAAKSAALEKVKLKIKDSPQLAMEVTDHALIQYLKRALNMNDTISKAVTGMLNLCDSAGDFDEQNRAGEGVQYVYETDGPNNTHVKFIVKQNKIITCIIDNQEKKEGVG